MRVRADLLTKLASQPFDLLVIGGGIVGAGIARDAAMRGLKTALIEQGDFASGTSSKTSKLIHGGLRYLEQGHLGLVFESLRERYTLRTIIPAYVLPLSLLLPIYAGDARPAWKMNLGLWIYDALAWECGLPVVMGGAVAGHRHRWLSAHRALAEEPALRAEGLRAAGVYADCQMDDARVCLANILQAVNFGAVCANYVRLKSLLKVQQRLCGGVGEDVFTGRTFEVHATVVINATGPWADQVRTLSDGGTPPRLAPTKGIHLIVPRLARRALFAQARADGRMLFLLPWGDDYSLIGTTESAVTGPLETLAADAHDVGYLLEEVNRLVPGRHLSEADIVATFAGARPLLAFSGSPNAASREHRLEVDRWGLVSVMGGKFTTYRRIAQQAVDHVVTRNRWRVDRCLTDQVSLLDEAQPVTLEQWEGLTRSLDPDLVARLIARYGAAALHVLQVIDREPTLGHAVCPHHDTVGAEVVHAFRRELACTLTDVLARRTRIAWSSCQGLDALSVLTEWAQRYAGLSPLVLEQQVDEYRRFLQRAQAFRGEALSSRVGVSHD